jgi:hypothetical protein
MEKPFRVKKSFCGIEVGTILTNVPTQYQAELVEQGFIEEKKDTKTKEKTEK